MGNRKPAAQRNPAPAATKVDVKPGDDVTADYFALSNTAVAGVHFASGDPIIGVTDRDQIALALRIGAIGPNPPGTTAPHGDAAAQIEAALTDAGAADAVAAKRLLATVASTFVDLGARMGEGAKVLIELTKEAFERANAEADKVAAAATAAETAASEADAADEMKALAVSAAEQAKEARAKADAAFAAFEEAEDFAEGHAQFDTALKAAVAELGK